MGEDTRCLFTYRDEHLRVHLVAQEKLIARFTPTIDTRPTR